jgi:hypothetical protein
MEGRYIDIPGTKTHQLPPLLVHSATQTGTGAEFANFDSILPEAEDMLADSGAAEADIEQRKFDLAVQLTTQYKGLLTNWWWGDSVLEWVRQCEITFGSEDVLRKLLHPDVWPHASRASFVALLMEKGIATHGIALDRAVGMRLAFRQPPPIECVSSQFLFYLNSTIGRTAYATWSQLAPDASVLLPPNRFAFDVMDLDSDAN